MHRNTATHHLFTYGTLQEKEVQLGVFSRLLGGYNDTLHGHRISDIKVAGLYPTLEPTHNPQDKIHGKVFVLTDDELKKADLYEGDAYERIEVGLLSGKKAWVYLAR
ncbi:gamma-glutamylcyclotransferase [Maribacter flavus]|uniref:Putative gamma-glutamylcyclotransferase n=1 Tax=Maribacter flavus TaxID=1658664 RepID=A0A5B2TZP2_9FLAO|nr:gamma-glutamylcyclotransferase [Maribacter flavus]